MSKRVPCVLAIDLGTSGPKTAVVSATGEIRALGQATVTTLHLPDGGVEQDPREVWQAVKDAALMALRASGVTRDEVEAILVSSQYASILPVGADGQHLMNMVMWMDKRGATERLKKLPGYPRINTDPLFLLPWIQRHGLGPLGTADESLAKMRWIQYARPEIYERTSAFVEAMDFVNLRLTGNLAANQCTALMLYTVDNRRLNQTQHDPLLVRFSGIAPEKLPPLLPCDAVVGTLLPEVAEDLGLSPKTKVFTGINDTQASAMGAGAYGGTHASLSFGSTSSLVTHVPFKRTDIFHAMVSIPSPVPDTWFLMGENGVAGVAIEHLLSKIIFAEDAFGALDNAARFEALGRAVREVPPGAGGVLFMPWLAGALAPCVEPRMRGGFLNLGVNSTRSHLARAVLEGVALNVRWMRVHAEKFCRRSFTHFLFHGGGAQSDVWAHILADVLQCPIHQLQHPRHIPCLGDAFLALSHLGHLSLDDAARHIPVKNIFDPTPAHRAPYDELYPHFLQSFHRNRPLFRALNSFHK